MPTSPDNKYSSYRESLLEHLFLGELLRHLWLTGCYQVEVMKPQVDGAGYDVVVQVADVIRHIQLKGSFVNVATREVTINENLAAQKGGCVVWICFNKKTLTLGPFHWFGGRPRSPLPSLNGFPLAKHTRANAQGKKKTRKNARRVRKTAFENLDTIDQLAVKLFGRKTIADKSGLTIA